jgi:hypothetical protein
MGKTPISTDEAVEEVIVISYYLTIVEIGTDVISFRLYPNINALNEIINPMIIIRLSLFTLLIYFTPFS